jgi:hypothetical protein
LNPSYLLGGKDLLNIGVPAGPLVGHLLTQLRALQLDEKVTSREAAIKWVEQQCVND